MIQAAADTATIRLRLRVEGRVQGVGFRPFAYRLARECAVAGFVRNGSNGVLIEIEGPIDRACSFERRLTAEAPPAARIDRVHSTRITPTEDEDFRIATSGRAPVTSAQITPDLAVCPDCLRELADPEDRRFGYPFLNCTRCGPRFTIVRGIPYDRKATSMSVFKMCPACRAEYEDPCDRRFHAQPVACPECGPRLALAHADGSPWPSPDPIAESAALLLSGKIVAVRGLGGFHLAVDPADEAAVLRLRERKRRPAKPFALMTRSIEEIRTHAAISDAEAELLADPARPIVLLRAHGDTGLAASVAPGRRELGFMLAYTPLHELLLAAVGRPLIMTSGNRAEEPIAISNGEAMERLAGIADAFVLHDRDILQRCDDSVARVVDGLARPLRRSRGYVPGAVPIPVASPVPLLAVGGELKNTVTLVRGSEAFPSQHIGELTHPLAFGFFIETIGLLRAVLEIEPAVLVHDLHPDYRSTRWALAESGLRAHAVQHHHAHLASVLAEHGRTDRAIGLILDGTGFGPDGTIWGGEVLIGDLVGYERYAWLRPFPLPGGDAAVREPWRTACALLYETYGPDGLSLDLPGLTGLESTDRARMNTVLDRRLNTPMTSSAGRLFDGISALAGVCTEVSYEGEAAIRFESLAGESGDAVSLPPATDGTLDWRPLVHAVVEDLQAGLGAPLVSARFHASLARALALTARRCREQTGLETVALSGGVFQNVLLDRLVTTALDADGFEVLRHRLVPPNDGGLSYGQAAVAAAHLAKSR